MSKMARIKSGVKEIWARWWLFGGGMMLVMQELRQVGERTAEHKSPDEWMVLVTCWSA